MSVISLNIILDNLPAHQFDTHVTFPCDKVFNRVVLLPRDWSGITPEWLYVCRLSDYIRVAPQLAAGVYCICLRDRMADGSETEELMANTIIINENIELEHLFTEIQDIFFRINEWIQEMQNKVICGENFQEVVTLSEPVIGNTINVSDSTLTLLAHTWNIETDDELTLALVENGYHPEDSIQRFRKSKRFEIWDNTSGLIIYEHPDFGTYPLVSKVFKFHNTYFAHVVMVCDHKPLTQGLRDLFQIMLDTLQFYMKREWDNRVSADHAQDTLLTDILNGSLKNKAMLEERARHAGIPMNGSYRVLKISGGETMQAPVGRMARELQDLMPKDQVLVYQQQIMILEHLRPERETDDALRCQMNSFLERYDAICATSTKFTSLTGLPRAYEKACLALKYCGHIYKNSPLEPHGPRDAHKRIFDYDDNLVFYLLGENDHSQAIWRDSVYAQALHTLREYDNQHNTEDLYLLYIYLRCERKATDASQLLHMHRNNIVYHVGRIEEILGLDLNDADVRMGLNLSYMMLRLYGFES